MLKKFAIVLVALGTITILGALAFQLFGDKVISEIKKGESTVVTVPTQEFPTLPDAPTTEDTVEVREYNIKIANRGGDREMDYCADGFTEMIHYKGLNGLRMLAQHNNCGGDIILPIEMGDRVVIEGDQEYVVTELRDTTKQVDTTAINNMNGTILLQTCYWRENRMKFVALTPLTEFQETSQETATN